LISVVFRADSSERIGTGHVMRCLTLADKFRVHNARIMFICRSLPGNINEYIGSRGYPFYLADTFGSDKSIGTGEVSGSADFEIQWESDYFSTRTIISEFESKIDLLVLDHYGLDKRWEARLRPCTKKIMVIDDLADRPHDCDILLDQNLYSGMYSRYDGLVPDNCIKLLGPKYVLLRQEFLNANIASRNGGYGFRLFIFFGGGDPTGETVKALNAIKRINIKGLVVDIIVGSANPNKVLIQQLCSVIPDVNYYEQVENIAELMAQADLAIGGGGTTSWERCYLGLPAITIAIAENQVEIINELARTGVLWNLGWHENVESKNIADAIKHAFTNRSELENMGKRAKELMIGLFDWNELFMDDILKV
jgi:UDP-2,4-diacetamido-2,4,6-trideoxy-beta-L-altropyranose hydrolase